MLWHLLPFINWHCCHFYGSGFQKNVFTFHKIAFIVIRHHSLWIETTGPKIEILILYWCSHDMIKQRVHILFKMIIFTRIAQHLLLKNILKPLLKVKRFCTFINKLGSSCPRGPVLGPKCRSPGARFQGRDFHSATLMLNSFLRFCHFLLNSHLFCTFISYIIFFMWFNITLN